jgi:diphosphomevalonate decarboxylase
VNRSIPLHANDDSFYFDAFGQRSKTLTRVIRASAPSNIALIKYWGKRNTKLNLPLTSSFSVSLTEMCSWTTVQESNTGEDQWDIHGDPSKSQKLLEVARDVTGDRRPLSISIQNTFPGGAGLASSASSMASLARALNVFLADGALSIQTLATWSRQGSGSSVRSLLPGYVLWEAGVAPEGEDCLVKPAFSVEQLPLSVVVCVVNDQPKPIGSTAAMERCRDTSPNYQAFHDRNPADLSVAMEAVAGGDFAALADVAESNCLAMHDVMHKATPAIDYFLPGTHAAIAKVRELRASGVDCFFSIDAGPNVKICCPPTNQAAIAEACESLPGVKFILKDEVCGSLPAIEVEDGE